MQFARLQSEKSVGEIVARVYGLKPGDSRAVAAGKALLAADPQLNNLTNLPEGTPVVVPEVAGLNATSSANVDPSRAGWMIVLDNLLDSANQASNAQDTGLATTTPKTPNSQRTRALAQLKADIAEFKKVH
jgi:hypothetical protein